MIQHLAAIALNSARPARKSKKDGLTVVVATKKILRRSNKMKNEDLIALGIDEETAKKVMALHGTVTTGLHGKLSAMTAERDGLQEQVTTNQTELDALKESAKGNEELTAQLADLQAKLDQSKTESETKLATQQKDFAIQLALKEANALDESIVLGLLDKDTIKVTDNGLQGFEEQLKTLQESKAFLFQAQQEETPAPTIFSGGNPKPPKDGDSDPFKNAVSKFI